MPPKVSIIIPTYNVESYIARCLDSCINQSLRDIEMIIVDDCGSDSSIQIAQSYADKDSRIKIVHNENNLGTFATRIVGIRQAVGEYIAFLDADDYLATNACEKSYNATQISAQAPANPNPANLSKSKPSTQEPDTKPDIVFFGMRFEPRTFKRVSPPVLCKPLFGDEVLYEVFAHCATPPWHIWAKLYKASPIRGAIEKLVAHMGENVRLTMAEDVLKSFWLTALATKSIGIPDKLYVYCDSSSSITRKIDAKTRDKKIADIGQVITELGKLSQVDCLRANASFSIAQRRAIAILTSVQVLEHRYDGLINGGWGGGSIHYGLSQVSTLPSQVADLCALAWLYLFSRVCQALESSLESTFSKVDSASGEQCGSVAKIVKGTNAKFANLPQFLQSSHSPTANLRILEEEKQAGRENAAHLLESQSGLVQGKAAAGFFRNLGILEEESQAGRENSTQNLESTFQNKDSRNAFFTSAESMDCHATAAALARNDRKNAASKKVDSRNEAQNLNKSAKDSRNFNKNAQNVFCSQVDRRQDFCDKNGALQGESKARTWACVTADSPQQSPFLAKKPTPKTSKAQSSNNAQNVFCSHATRRQDFLKKHRLTPSGIPCFLKKHQLTPSGIPCFRAASDSYSTLESTFETTPTIAQKVDSSTAQSVSDSTKDSRISRLESGLSRQWQGSYLSGSDRRHCRRIHDSSPKAESTSPKAAYVAA